jgi:dinuclear metal center YbgI/SA1388 family protein
MPELQTVVSRLDSLLRIEEVPDYPGAVNGLQLENSGVVTRVACAVDFSLAAARRAVELEADLLVVHHGMFWGGERAIRGSIYQRLALLVGAGVAVYSAHLPLDVHPELGNNVLLAHQLGLEPSGGFIRYQTAEVGLSGEGDVATSELLERTRSFARQYGGDVVSTPMAEGRRTRRWGLCTGAGASSDSIREARLAGIDTLVVGEGPHHTAVEAIDADIAVIYAGHYATETLGVRAVGELLSSEFGVPWHFLHLPTGL